MKKRILLVATEPAPGMVPFASTIINTLAQDSRFSVKCICVSRAGSDYRNYIDSSVDAVFLNMPENRIKRLIYKFWPSEYISTIRRVELEFRPDCVHFLTGEFSLALSFLFTPKSNHYLMVHDLRPHEVVHRKVKDAWLEKWILLANRLCRYLIPNLTTCSYEQVDELVRLHPDKNVRYVPFPTLVTDRIATGSKPVMELEGVDNYILFFGSLQLYKGVLTLVESFKALKHDDSLKLVIAGRGDVVVEDHKDIIRIDRFIDDEEVASLFGNSRFVVYPYLSATLSGVLSIAYFFNRRVLLSDIPFFKENASDNCTFFKCGDVADLTDKLQYLIADETVVDSTAYDCLYSKKNLADKYIDLYSDERI